MGYVEASVSDVTLPALDDHEPVKDFHPLFMPEDREKLSENDANAFSLEAITDLR